MKTGENDKEIPGSSDLGYNPLLLLEALKMLADSGAEYLLVGGIASNLHGIAEGTKDIDILIPKDLENTQKILDALAGLTCGMAREIDASEVIGKPFTIIGDLPRVDLLIVAGKTNFQKASPNKIVRTIQGIRVPVVSLDDLIESKKTGRPKDKIKIEELEALKKI